MTVTYSPTDTFETSAQEFDDGDAPTTGNINPLGEAAFNTASWAANRVGELRPVWVGSFYSTAAADLLSNDDDAYASASPAVYDLIVPADGVSVLSGDIFEVTVAFSAHHNSTTEDRVEFELLLGGYLSSVSYWEAAALMRAEIPAGSTLPVTMHATYTWTLAASGVLIAGISARWVVDPGSDFITISSPINAGIKVWRSNA